MGVRETIRFDPAALVRVAAMPGAPKPKAAPLKLRKLPRQRDWPLWFTLSVQLVLLVSFVGFWELATRAKWIDAFFWSSPSAIYGTLLTFFTAGPKEARAWTTHSGALAPQAAGEIHTDFEKGFIRAEVIAYDDYVALEGELGAKEAGKMRLEGKEYVVREGDVMHFRFNV
jgi:hypothetical protein